MSTTDYFSKWIAPAQMNARLHGSHELRRIAAAAHCQGHYPAYVPVLKITDHNWTTQGGLQWPERGPVYPDRFDEGELGAGLYGFLFGHGDAEYVASRGISVNTPACLLAVPPWPMYGGRHKIKFPRAIVAYRGDLGVAGAYIDALLEQHGEIYRPWIDFVGGAMCIYRMHIAPPKQEATQDRSDLLQYRREQMEYAEAERRRRKALRKADRSFWRNYVLVTRPAPDSILVDGWPVPEYAKTK